MMFLKLAKHNIQLRCGSKDPDHLDWLEIDSYGVHGPYGQLQLYDLVADSAAVTSDVARTLFSETADHTLFNPAILDAPAARPGMNFWLSFSDVVLNDVSTFDDAPNPRLHLVLRLRNAQLNNGKYRATALQIVHGTTGIGTLAAMAFLRRQTIG